MEQRVGTLDGKRTLGYVHRAGCSTAFQPG